MYISVHLSLDLWKANQTEVQLNRGDSASIKFHEARNCRPHR